MDYGTKPNSERQTYVYDGLNRRIARLTYQYAVFGEASYMIPDVGKRYIYDGFTCVEELLLDTDGDDEEEIFVDSGTLERVYVHGASIDEPVYCAIDRNGDRDVSDNRNDGGASDDAEFWYLHNRLGSILAIAEITFGETDTVRVLEYYKYNVYGQVDVLPIVDDGSGGGTASDGIEDTPTTLADNQSLMISNRSGSADAGRYSPFGNEFLFTARRLDARTGLYYYRHRYYNWLMGRFVSRDPIGYADGLNLYAYVGNTASTFKDPTGKETEENLESCDGGCCPKSLDIRFAKAVYGLENPWGDGGVRTNFTPFTMRIETTKHDHRDRSKACTVSVHCTTEWFGIDSLWLPVDALNPEPVDTFPKYRI